MIRERFVLKLSYITTSPRQSGAAMITLLYYIRDKSQSISSTNVELSDPVDRLRQNILAERPVLAGLDSDRLTLWKVCYSFLEI